jgi:hypothetical protein
MKIFCPANAVKGSVALFQTCVPTGVQCTQILEITFVKLATKESVVDILTIHESGG